MLESSRLVRLAHQSVLESRRPGERYRRERFRNKATKSCPLEEGEESLSKFCEELSKSNNSSCWLSLEESAFEKLAKDQKIDKFAVISATEEHQEEAILESKSYGKKKVLQDRSHQ